MNVTVNIWCIALTSLMLCSPASAQPNPLLAPQGQYIISGENKLILAGDHREWERWQQKMDRLLFEGRGQLNVVHIGGSHIQADMWSMQMRHRMQHMAPGVRGSRGLIFPYTMAKSNNPWWYHPEFTGNWTSAKNTRKDEHATLGMTGYAVTTHDSVSTLKVSFRGDMYAGHTFNRIKVLHRQDSSFVVDAFSNDSTLSIARVVHVEDGYTEFIYDRNTDTLHLRFQKENDTQLRFTIYGIIMENDDPGFIYHACGVNGASTTSWLRCERFAQELALLKPDLVVFSIGINDAHDSDFTASKYKRNYEELIARVRSVAPDAAILLTTNTDSYVGRKVPNKNAGAVRDVMMQLSREQGAVVWDTFGVMGGEGSIRNWEAAGLAKNDRVHFTRAGYVVLGDLLFTALMESYGDHIQKITRP